MTDGNFSEMGQTKTRAKRPFQNYVSWKYHPKVGNNVMKTNFTICLREICDLLNAIKTNFTICLREICDLLNVMKTNFTICLREICDLLNVMKTNFTICLREICDLLNVLQAPLQTGKVSIRNKIHQQI